MTTAFLISSLNSGGAERVVSLLANEMVNYKKIIIITLNKEKPFYFLDDRVEVLQLGVYNDNQNKIKGLISNFILIAKIRRIIKHYKIEHLICFMTTSNVLGIIAGKFLSKIKVTISERANPNSEKLGYWDFLRRKTYNFCDNLIVQSDYFKTFFLQYVDYKKIKIISNPVKLTSKKYLNKEKIILTVGRVDRNKNQEQILKSFSRIKNDGWKLVLCGDGPLLEELKTLTQKLGLEKKVEFTGKVNNIEEYYERASVFAFSSLSEGFPNVLLEAISYGCACISTDCPCGPSEIIEHNKNGFLIPLENFNSFDVYFQMLLDDDKLRDKFCNNSNEILQNYSLNTIARKWLI